MTHWLLNVNFKSGNFYLNDLIRQDLDLKCGDSAVVAYDEDGKEWYISFDPNVNGFRLHKLCNQGGKQSRLVFGCRPAVVRMLENLPVKSGVTFIVARRPKEEDGCKWYRIMTQKPYRIN